VPVVHYELAVKHNARKMYDLVNDVESYHEFVPFCSHGEPIEQGDGWKKAALSFSFSGFTHTFTTKNTYIEGALIDIELVDGPFRHLDGKWQFSDQKEGGSLVTLDMDFEVTGLLSFAFEPIFQQISHTLVDVFAKRADEVYQ